MSFLHADYAESAEFFYFPWRITLALEGSQTSLRRESAEGRCKRGCLITSYIAFVTRFRTRHAVSLLLVGGSFFTFPFLFVSALSVARSERLIQRQRSLLWNSAFSALSA